MKIITFSLSLIGTGLVIGFTLIVYAHANFATKEALISLKNNRVEHQRIIREDIKEMKSDIKEIRNFLIKN